MNENKIIQGTTPTFEIELLDVTDATIFDAIEIIIRQCTTKIERTTKDDEITIEGKTLRIKLTQEETLGLRAGLSAAVQIRAIQEGTAYASEIMPVFVCPLVENEIIEGGENNG